MTIKRVIAIVMDSVGAGCMPDACNYNDGDVNTLEHIYKKRGHLDIPNLCSFGLGNIAELGCSDDIEIKGNFGRMKEVSPGKDTTTGHWEMAGLNLDFSFRTYPDGFPEEIMREFEQSIGRKTLGNYAQSGTEILKELGEEHVKTGSPIVYTSADSVFQIATHNDVIPLNGLYEICDKARGILKGEHTVGRVIARPFKGATGNFQRDNANRKDYSVSPPEDTLLDYLKKEGLFVCGVGKIGDIFAHTGLTEEIHSDDNMDGIDKTIESIKSHKGQSGLIFVNLVEFDSVYGHRRDFDGYGRALEDLDKRITEIVENLDDEELLMFTADHGCDPTHEIHTDHTREYVPLLVYGKAIKNNVDLGTRQTFSDFGQTIADILGVGPLKFGKSFAGEIL